MTLARYVILEFLDDSFLKETSNFCLISRLVIGIKKFSRISGFS